MAVATPESVISYYWFERNKLIGRFKLDKRTLPQKSKKGLSRDFAGFYEPIKLQIK